MRLLIGLGNPGDKYKKNRHNVGHMFTDYIQKLEELPVRSAKTNVFMNQSGGEVKKLTTYYKLPTSDLIIVHDDLDITLGNFKIEKGTGPKLHNGISSIEKSLRTKDFWRVRIGVDNPSTRFTRSGQVRIDGETYLLQNFAPQEMENLPQIFKEVVDKLKNVFHNELIK